ncbi:unnamed protein product [Bathycoccus prasinos]
MPKVERLFSLLTTGGPFSLATFSPREYLLTGVWEPESSPRELVFVIRPSADRTIATWVFSMPAACALTPISIASPVAGFERFRLALAPLLLVLLVFPCASMTRRRKDVVVVVVGVPVPFVFVPFLFSASATACTAACTAAGAVVVVPFSPILLSSSSIFINSRSFAFLFLLIC